MSLLHDLIPNFEEQLIEVRDLAPAGFILAFSMNFRGPEHLISEYPPAWRSEYEDNNYFAGDPVLIWALSHSGHRRWSEVNLPDVFKIMKRGEAYGLHHGAVFSTKKQRKRSFLTVARSDREFTDAEINTLAAKFDVWSDLVTNRAALTDKEVDVMKLLRDGYGQTDISEKLQIASSTVKQRANSATVKLNAKNRTHAVAIAVARGYLD